MSENQEKAIKSKIEIPPFDPELWEKEEQDYLLGLSKLLIEIDMRNNPDNYKLQFNQTNPKSHESNNLIRNSNSTRQT